MKVKFKKLSPDAVIPKKAHPTDAGLDLTATSRVFDEKGSLVYGTGLAAEIPSGYVGLVFPRSSIANKDLLLSNSVGVIDSGYRGEIMVKFKPSLVYVDKPPLGIGKDFSDIDGTRQTDPSTQEVTFHGRDESYPDISEGCLPFPPRIYEVGDRVAQLIIIPYPDIVPVEAENLSTSDRGTHGYGSTGK